MTDFGKRIKALRSKKKQSLQKIADAVGVSKTHIWELETGRSRNPSVGLLVKLADYYKVTIASLVGEDLNATTDSQIARMFRQAGELDNRDRAVLGNMIQEMHTTMMRRGNSEKICRVDMILSRG
jgi:transcriptional regulator with XRE-family HTH domain